MTDKVRYLTVQLDDDFRTDDVAPIVQAILAMRHVYSVHMGQPVNPSDWSARLTAEHRLRERIQDVLWPKAACE